MNCSSQFTQLKAHLDVICLFILSYDGRFSVMDTSIDRIHSLYMLLFFALADCRKLPA